MLRVFVLAVNALAASATVTHLTFGQDVDYPPYAYINSSTGELAGIGYDIVQGMNALCPSTLNITVVQTNWADCWSSAGGGTLGAKLNDSSLDACMTYTHTQGIRNVYADFSIGILAVNKAAGLLTLLENGMPKVNGSSDLNGLNVVDVGGWAPTADGLGYVTNKCTGEKYSSTYTLLTGDGNDASMQMLRDGTADVMFVYSDQAKNYQCGAGITSTWNCSLWTGFGTEYAYVQTGQFGYTINGTTLALTKKGSGVDATINPCLAQFMATQEYYDICVKYDQVDNCVPNSFFPSGSDYVHEYNRPTNEHATDCSDGYCWCPGTTSTATTTTSQDSGFSSANNLRLAVAFVVALGCACFS